MTRGVDVSAWSGAVDWQRLHADGYRFAIPRTSRGKPDSSTDAAGRDPRWKANRDGALAAGMVTGGYHRADPSQTPKANVDLFLGHLGDPQKLFIVLDVEDTAGKGRAALTDWTIAALQLIEQRTGKRPVFYTYWNFLINQVDRSRLTRWPWWIAHGSADDYPAGSTIWQHQLDTPVPGVQGRADLNWARSIAAVKELTGGSMRIIPRSEWGARYGDGNGSRPLPATEAWLHHSVTAAPDLKWVDANGDGVDDDERAAMRFIEDIGRDRFGSVYGFPYTFAVMPSGRVYQGHAVGQQGAHTGGHNYQGIGIVFVGNYDNQRPTDAQLDAVAWLLNEAVRKGWLKQAELTGGHRDTKATACPGAHAYAQIAEINRRAQEDDMPSAEEIAEAVWSTKLRKVNSRDSDGNWDGKEWQARWIAEWSYGHSGYARAEQERQARDLAAAVGANGAAIDALSKALAEHDGQLDPEAFAAQVREASEAGARAALDAMPLAAVLVRDEEEPAS